MIIRDIWRGHCLIVATVGGFLIWMYFQIEIGLGEIGIRWRRAPVLEIETVSFTTNDYQNPNPLTTKVESIS